MDTVFYSNAAHRTIDLVGADGKGLYGKETLDQVKIRYPDAEMISIDEAITRTDAAFRHPPTRVTRERYLQMLEVLPPVDWRGIGSTAESFKLSERTCGNITAIFCRIGESYWELQDDITLPHAEIVARVRAAAGAA